MDATSHEAVSHELPSHTRESRVRHRFQLILVWAVWVTGTVALFLYVRHYARNIPYMDDWELVPVVTGHRSISLKWAWSQHNEHRAMLPRLILVSLFRWIARDFRTGLYLNAGLLSLAGALMIVLARRLRGHTRLTDAVLPFSILTLAQAEVLLIGFALNLVLTAWMSYALIAVLARASERPPWMSVIPISTSVVLLPLCGGSGLVMLPPLMLWLAGYLCWGWWSGRGPGGWARAFGLLSLMACSAIVALYLSDYVKPAHHPSAPSLGAIVRTSLEVLSLPLSSRTAGYWKTAAVTMVALVAVALIRLTAVAVRLPQERPRALGLAAVILSMMGVAISVGVSRSGFGPGAGLLSRYVSLATPLLSALYVTWLIYTPARPQRALQACLLLVVCLSVPGSLQKAKDRGDPARHCFRQMERSLRAGKPDSQILDLACPALYPHRQQAREMLEMLKSSGFGNFQHLDDARIAITSKPESTRR